MTIEKLVSIGLGCQKCVLFCDDLLFSWQLANQNTINPSSSLASNLILNHDFSEGLHSWHANCCEGFVVSADSVYPKGIAAELSGNYAVVTNRKECWQGLEQDITARITSGSRYCVSAFVGVSGPFQGSTDVLATLKLEYQDSVTSYFFIGK